MGVGLAVGMAVSFAVGDGGELLIFWDLPTDSLLDFQWGWQSCWLWAGVRTILVLFIGKFFNIIYIKRTILQY